VYISAAMDRPKITSISLTGSPSYKKQLALRQWRNERGRPPPGAGEEKGDGIYFDIFGVKWSTKGAQN